MVYCYLKEFYILFIFFGIVLALTKEPGVIIYSLFIGAAVLINLLKYKEAVIIEHDRKSFLSVKFLANIVPPILFLFFFMISRGITMEASARDMYAALVWDNNGSWCFGFNPRFILEWLILFFVSNSIWLTSIVCICGLAVYIYRFIKKRQINVLAQKNEPVFMGIIGIFAVYIVFTCLYLLPYCPRYATLGGFWLAILAFASVHVLFHKKVWRNVVLGVLALLFLVQTYINIDPYMRLRSFYVYTGKRFVYGAVYKEVPEGWAGDSRNYNYEYNFYNSMLQDVLRYIEPDPDTIIVQMMVTHVETMICGLETSIYWNTRTKKRTYDYKDPDSIYLKVPVLNEPDDVLKYEFPDTFYLLTIPYFEYYEPLFLGEFKKRGYSVSGVHKAENTVGLMTVYKMSKPSSS
jgi:hypothetical protein